MRIVRSPICDLLALRRPAGRVMSSRSSSARRGVGDRHLGDGHVVERDVGDRAVEAVDPHQHGLAGVAATALHRQVDVVRHRVHGHVPDDDVVGLAAEERGDAHVDVVQVEGLRAGLGTRIGHVDGEHLGRWHGTQVAFRLRKLSRCLVRQIHLV